MIQQNTGRERKKERERVKAVARAEVVRRFLVLRLQKEKVEILLDAVEILRRKEKEQNTEEREEGARAGVNCPLYGRRSGAPPDCEKL